MKKLSIEIHLESFNRVLRVEDFEEALVAEFKADFCPVTFTRAHNLQDAICPCGFSGYEYEGERNRDAEIEQRICSAFEVAKSKQRSG